MDITSAITLLIVTVLCVMIVMSMSRAAHQHTETRVFAARETREPQLVETQLDNELISTIITGIIAGIAISGSLYILAFVPNAPREIVTMILGAILGYYFTRRAKS